MFNDRKTAIQQRQILIQQEIRLLQQQIASRDASINTLLVHAAASELGLPPNTLDVLNSASKGDYSGVISTVAQQYAASPDALGGIPTQLKQLAAEADEETAVRSTRAGIFTGPTELARAVSLGFADEVASPDVAFTALLGSL